MASNEELAPLTHLPAAGRSGVCARAALLPVALVAGCLLAVVYPLPGGRLRAGAAAGAVHSLAASSIQVTESKGGCRTAVEGDDCYNEVTYAMEHITHPGWYQGLSNESSFEEVQDYLRKQGHEKCAPPCGLEEAGAEDGCHTAAVGDECYNEVGWAKEHVGDQPSLYKGLNASSSLEEFQAFLWKEGHEHCQKPCGFIEERAVGEDGCHTAVVGEECYDEVDDAMQGFKKDPGMYPGFTEASGFEEFQAFLAIMGHRKCRKPCDEESAERASLLVKEWKDRLEHGYHWKHWHRSADDMIRSMTQ